MPRWNKESVAAEILRRHHTRQDLSYSAMSRQDLPLLRAAATQFGSWRAAIEFAGLDYGAIRKYQVWTNGRILERIRALHARGEDLSWGNVSLRLDPALAAAAVKECHFGSWKAALEQAGLEYEPIRRYREWSREEVLGRVRDLHAQGKPLNAKSLQREDLALLTAARRRFAAWDQVLSAAGLDYRRIVVRAPFRRGACAARGGPAQGSGG